MAVQRNTVTALELEQFVVVNVQLTGVNLGAGAYGNVEEVEIPGARVAAKTLHFQLVNLGSPQQVEKWTEECLLMSQLRHPHIVQFLGVCYLPGSPLPALLMEKLVTSLDNLLETSPNIPLDVKVHLLIGTVRGVVYLHNHTPPIAHCNLTARNILIDSGLTAKIVDLSEAKMVIIQPGQLAPTMPQAPGNILHMPPEAVQEKEGATRYNTSIDIFSFGVVSLFTLTQTFPKDLKPATYRDPTTRKIVDRSEIERREDYVQLMQTALGETHSLVKLTLDCLEYDPEDRPSVVEVLRRLEEVGRMIPLSCSETKLELIRLISEKEREMQQNRIECSHLQAANNRLQAEKQEQVRGFEELTTLQQQQLEVQRREIEQLSGQLRSLELQSEEEGSQRSRQRDVSMASPKKKKQLDEPISKPDSHQPLHFIKPVKEIEATQEGGKYVDDSLGLSIQVPEGVVPEGCQLKLEVGMCLYGPFLFPPGTAQISPVLMLRPQDNIRLLKKPLRVTMPHIISQATDSDVEALDIQVTKAAAASNQYSLIDVDPNESQIKLWQKDGKGYATFSLLHFCFISLRARIDSRDAKSFGYCVCALCPFPAPTALDRFTYFLALTFDMDPCIEEVQQLFQARKYNFFQPEVFEPFSLRGEDDCIRCSIGQVDSGWKASLTSADEQGSVVIKAGSIDIWNMDERILMHNIKRWRYPPSFQVTVISQQALEPTFLKIRLETETNGHFYLNLPLQLQKRPVTSLSLTNEVDSRLTIIHLQELVGLSDNQLDQELSFSDLPPLAELFDDVKIYVGKFKLTRAGRADVEKEKSTQSSMQKALFLWHEKNPPQATYRNLINIALSLNKGSTAREVCEFVSKLK